MFSIKCLVKTNPLKVVMTCLFTSLAYFGLALRLTESAVVRDYYNTREGNYPTDNLYNYYNCVWYVLIK